MSYSTKLVSSKQSPIYTGRSTGGNTVIDSEPHICLFGAGYGSMIYLFYHSRKAITLEPVLMYNLTGTLASDMTIKKYCKQFGNGEANTAWNVWDAVDLVIPPGVANKTYCLGMGSIDFGADKSIIFKIDQNSGAGVNWNLWGVGFK